MSNNNCIDSFLRKLTEQKTIFYNTSINIDEWICVQKYCQANAKLQKSIPIAGKIDYTFEQYLSELENNQFGQFDVVSLELPYGMRAYQADGSIEKNSTFVDSVLQYTLNNVSKEGIVIFNTTENNLAKKTLEKNGFYIQAVILLPKDTLKPFTGIRPCFVIASRNDKALTLAGILGSEETSVQLAENIRKGVVGKNLQTGIEIDIDKFESFGALTASIEIKKLETDYSEYKTYLLKDVLKVEDSESGSLFISRQASQKEVYKVLRSLEGVKNTKRFIEIEVNKQIVEADYLISFFSGSLGQLLLRTVSFGISLPSLSPNGVKTLTVPIPPLEIQRNIIGATHKLEKLKIELQRLTDELALRPNTAKELDSKLLKVHNELNLATDADKVKSYLRAGESDKLEFKQTLSMCIKTSQKHEGVTISALKTIAGYLNTQGGNLLIGVDDNSEVTGLSKEIEGLHKNSEDKYLLYFKDLISSKLGEYSFAFINYRIVSLGSKKVLLVECEASDKPCYFDKKIIYVRRNPATVTLEGPELDSYLRKRFP
jgi:hypothetical protein